MLSRMSNLKDNYFRILCLVFETTPYLLRKLMLQYLNRTKITLSDLINKHQHEIYHYFTAKKCCFCTKTPTSSRTVIKKEQLMELFDTSPNTKRLAGHNFRQQSVCCCPAKHIVVNDLDFTLLKFLMINFCGDEFWICFLEKYENDFEKFLSDEKHTLFHLWKLKVACCECRIGYSCPDEAIVGIHQFEKMYENIPSKCHIEDTCSCHFKPKRGLTFEELKRKEKVLFTSLTNYFCNVQKAIDAISDVRNKSIAHVKSMEMSKNDFESLWKLMADSLLEIAASIQSETDITQLIIEQCATRDLDIAMGQRWLRELLRDQDQQQMILDCLKEAKEDHDNNHHILGAKMDKCNDGIQSVSTVLETIAAEVKEQNDILKDFQNQMQKKCGFLNMHETNNNTVPIDIEPQSLKDGDFKDQILSNQAILGACRDKVSLSLAKEHNLQEYTVIKAELKLTLEKKKIQHREFRITSKESGNVFTDLNTLDLYMPRFYEFVQRLQEKLLYLSVYYWYTDDSSRWEEGLELENTSSDEGNNSFSESETDEEEAPDIYTCGGCGEFYNTLDLFVKHKVVCKSKKKTTKHRKPNSSSKDNDTLQVRMEFDRNDDVVHRLNQIQPKELSTESIITELAEKGSLVLWTKMSSSVTKKKESFMKEVDEFVFKLMDKCPVKTDEKTTLTVKIDVIEDLEGYEDDEDDVFKCGRCLEEFHSVALFCSHKRKCNKKLRNRRSKTQRISSRNKQSAIQEHIPSGSDRMTISVCSLDDNAGPQEQNSVIDLVVNGTTMSTCSVDVDVVWPLERNSSTDNVTNRTTMSICSVDEDAMWPLEQTSVTDLVTNRTTVSICSINTDVVGPPEQTSCTDSVTNAPDYTNTVMLPTFIQEYNVGEQGLAPFRSEDECINSNEVIDHQTPRGEDKQDIEDNKMANDCKQVEPKEITLTLYKDEFKMFESKLHNKESTESGIGVLRKIRKKKRKFVPFSKFNSGSSTSSYESDTDVSGASLLSSETDVSGSTDSGIDMLKSKKKYTRTKVGKDVLFSIPRNEYDSSRENEGSISSSYDEEYDSYLKIEEATGKKTCTTEGVTAEEEITQSFYEKSKQYTDNSKLENEELIKYGLQLSHECTIKLSSGFKRRKNFYEDFIEDSTTLNNLCKTEPLKYKRGILEIEASHSAKCRVSCQGEIDSYIEISGRSKCGKAYTDDEVVVEIIGQEIESERFIHMNKRLIKGKTFGKVIGILRRNRYGNMKYPVFICEIDEYEMDKAKPICKTLPKFHLVRKEKEKKQYSVDVYEYNKKNRNLEFKKSMTINRHSIKAYLFYVVCLSWDQQQYPIGAIFKVHQSTQNYVSTMKILELQYKVPSIYGDKAIIDVEAIQNTFSDSETHRYKSDRFDMTHLNVFTIDPEKSAVFDDAISIQKLPNGEFEVGIHITDVASVVQLDSDLDKEAWQRGTTYFPGQFLNPHHMLPEPISEDICCLLPDNDRLTLTVFLHFSSTKQMVFEKTRFCKTVVRSRQKLTYKEVQKIITDTNNEHQLKDEVKTLYDISRVVRRERLGNSAYAVPIEIEIPGEGDSNSFEAYSLIEEFMILTNYVVAILLQKHFPSCVPLRCQDPPSTENVSEWLQSYPIIADIILELQGKYPLPNRRLSIMNNPKLRPNDIVATQSWVWQSVQYSIRNKDFKHAKKLLCTDELHPLQALALNDWQQLQENAIYRCSGNISRKADGTHFSLGLCPYVHFTAPIRRYIDIVVQRLFHAAIDKKMLPYTIEEINRICNYFNNVSKNAYLFRSACKELVLASILVNKPFMTQGFVTDFSEVDISLFIPGMNFIKAQNKTIPISYLHISSVPQTKQDFDHLRATKIKEILVLKWKKRIYSVSQRPPRAKNLSKGYQRSPEEYQKLDPHQKSDYRQTSNWIQCLKLFISGASSSQLEKELGKANIVADNMQRRYLPSTFGSELDINSEITKEETKDETNLQVMFREQHCKYSFSFSHGQVVAVQYSSDMYNGLLTPTIDFLDMTNNIKFCLKHMRDPVSSLESHSTTKTKDQYLTSEEYKDTWIPIILMEASFCVVKESGILVNDVYLKFQERNGFFTLKREFCFQRSLEIGCITPSFLEDDLSQSSPQNNFNANVSDYLCIRCPIPYDENDTFLGQSLHCKSYFWIAHAKINRVIAVSKGDVNEKIKVYFKIVNDVVVPEKIRESERGVRCSIEILQRVESDKRMEVAVNFLNRSYTLAKAIALNKPLEDLDQEYLKRIKKCDVEIGLPANNCNQNEAIRVALKSSFCLIHGPPGTGKTNTGIKLIYLYNEINKIRYEDEGGVRQKVLFCGPSNKSVDLVARRLRKHQKKDGPSIIRFYGTTIEQTTFEIPGKVINDQKGMDYKPDPDMNDIAVHFLIRTSGVHAKEILKYEDDFKRNHANVTENKVKEYKKLLRIATIEELSRHDVIFCTTSMATSPRLLDAVRNNVFQLIIDECGMCTEPECISSIITTKPKQVVLIGDHMQLRPIIMCKQAAELGLDKSLFERYYKTGKFVQLDMQYRMHETICKFPSEQFYDGKLKTADSPSYVENPRLSIWLNDQGSHRLERHIFIHVEGIEELSQVSTDIENVRSVSNKMEVDQVVKIFNHLHNVEKIFSRGFRSLNIMSQYNAQCSALKDALPKDKLQHTDIHTVISSQGGEWDYVIFSLVRSLPQYRIEPHPTMGWCKENLGFITDHNQINVALTRAKKGLFIIGNKHLLSCDKKWEELIKDYESKRCVVDGKDFPKEPISTTRRRRTSQKPSTIQLGKKDQDLGAASHQSDTKGDE